MQAEQLLWHHLALQVLLEHLHDDVTLVGFAHAPRQQHVACSTSYKQRERLWLNDQTNS